MIQLRASRSHRQAHAPVNASNVTLAVRGKILTSRIEIAHCRNIRLDIHVPLALVQLDGALDSINVEHIVDDVASVAQIVYASSRHRAADISLAARSPDLPHAVTLQLVDGDGPPAPTVGDALRQAPILPPAGVAQCSIRLAQAPPDGDWAWMASALQREGGWPDLAT